MNIRFAVLSLIFIFLFPACVVYDVDSANNSTMAGSINRAVKKDRGRKEVRTRNYENAPTYVDYSKSNPLLRHDDEYDEDESYESDDPFEEKVEFVDYKRLKKRQQEKRSMDEDHELSDDEDAPLSLW